MEIRLSHDVAEKRMCNVGGAILERQNIQLSGRQARDSRAFLLITEEQGLNNDRREIPHNSDPKLLGVKMGDPALKIRDLIKCENITLLSSNYKSYGDFNNRVTQVLGSMVPLVKSDHS